MVGTMIHVPKLVSYRKMHWALNIRLTKYVLYDKINNRFKYSETVIVIIDNVVKEGI